MRYSASEKLEIIRTVERSHLSARQTLDKVGIPRTTFYRWYDRSLDSGFDALEDRLPKAPAQNISSHGLISLCARAPKR